MSYDPTKVVFVDTETTGLDPDWHDIWELAIIDDKVEYRWFFIPNLRRASPMALRIGDYYQRAPTTFDPFKRPHWSKPSDSARGIAKMLDGKHIVGAVPSFDAMFLERLLNRNGEAATWHYHLIDVEALAIGKLMGTDFDQEMRLPWKSEDLSRSVGVEPEDYEKHTALGDARWAKDMFEAVVGGPQ